MQVRSDWGQSAATSKPKYISRRGGSHTQTKVRLIREMGDAPPLDDEPRVLKLSGGRRVGDSADMWLRKNDPRYRSKARGY